jgi:hypothetical protein
VAVGVFEDFADVARLVEDLAVVEAERAEAGASVRLVALHVGRLLGDRAVVGEAVGLDHEPKLGPVEVDAEATEANLTAGRREAGGAGDRQEAALESGLRATERLCVEDSLQAPDPGARRLAVEGGPQSVGRDQSEMVSLVDGIFDFFGVVEASGEIDDDRQRIGNWYPLNESPRSDDRAPVQSDPRPPADHAARHRNVD